jgi:hypothetical protein
MKLALNENLSAMLAVPEHGPAAMQGCGHPSFLRLRRCRRP